MSITLKAWVGNLGAYNEGILIGERATFPLSDEEEQKLYKRIGIGSANAYGHVYEEVFVPDFDCEISAEDLGLSEYSSIDNINQVAEALESFDDDANVFQAIRDCCGGIREALDVIENCEYIVHYEASDYEDVGRLYAEKLGILDGLDEKYRDYFDFDAYGHDMMININATFTGDGRCVEVTA